MADIDFEDETIDCDDNEDVEDDDDMEEVDLGTILDRADINQGVSLPPHRRCASHTLSRIAVHDIEKILSAEGQMQTLHTAQGIVGQVQNALEPPIAEHKLARLHQGQAGGPVSPSERNAVEFKIPRTEIHPGKGEKTARCTTCYF